MSNFFAFFINRKTIAISFTVTVLLLGTQSLITIQKDAMPQVNLDQLSITTVYPGASPEDVELNVTDKIEQQLDTITGIDKYTSYSSDNLSSIMVVLDLDVKDVDKVKQDIRDKVAQVSNLPAAIEEKPQVIELETAVFRPILELGLSGDIAYAKLRLLVDDLHDKIKNLSGVSSIKKYGYQEREIQIQVDPAKLLQYQISLNQLQKAIASRHVRSTAGNTLSYDNERNIITISEFADPLEVADVVVSDNFFGKQLKIQDVATVVDGLKKATVVSHINGKPAISLEVFKKDSADILDTIGDIKDLVAVFEKQLPQGLDVLISRDESRVISNRLNIVLTNGLLGLFFVLIILTLFLNIRTAFWVAVSIPVALLGSIFLLDLWGETINVIMLSGMIIVLGLVVDDSIIIAENINRSHQKYGRNVKATIEGILQVFPAVLTTILTTMIAFGAMFFISGIMGKFIFTIPFIIIAALLFSLLEITIALPVHLYSKRKVTKKHKEWFIKFEKYFYTLTLKVITRRYICVLAFILALILAAYLLMNKMNFVLIPSEGADKIIVEMETPLANSLHANVDIVAKIEQIILRQPKDILHSLVTRVGVSSSERGATQVKNLSTIEIFLTPTNTRETDAIDIVTQLNQQTKDIQGFISVKIAVERRGPPTGADLVFNLVSNDNTQRLEAAKKLIFLLESTSYIHDIERNDTSVNPQVAVQLDYQKVARLGLNANNIANYLRTAFDGLLVLQDIRYGKDLVDFRLQFKQSTSGEIKNLADIKIPNNKGRLISLDEVADLVEQQSVSSVYHYNGKRSTTISASIKPNSNTTVSVANTQVLSQLDAANKWSNVQIMLGGESKETLDSLSSLASSFMLALALIYILLMLLFNSVSQPFLILTAIPFGFTGVIFALYLHGSPFTFMSVLGSIGMIGVVVNDTLVLITHLNRKLSCNSMSIELIAKGVTQRLRAVVLTSLTTIVGVLPLAYGIGGVDHMLASMALALGYGILCATVVTLWLVPCLYLIGHDIRGYFNGLIQRKQIA